MIKIILFILRLIPYKTKFGMKLDDLTKIWWYNKKNHHTKCLCNGEIVCYGIGQEGWIIECSECKFLYDED